MNDAQRAAIRQSLSTRTAAATASKKTAKAFLVREGFYTKAGELAPAYGGKKAD